MDAHSWKYIMKKKKKALSLLILFTQLSSVTEYIKNNDNEKNI